MIAVEGLTKIYRLGMVEVPALRGVTFELARGEFLGLMGPSGSGKSTLLHLIGLLDEPTAGTIRIDGVDVSSLDEDGRTEYRLRRMGYIFQDYALVPELTVWENVAITAMAQGKSEDESRRESGGILRRIGLGEQLDRLPRELSGGEQQRVAIARSMVNRPLILFADEPCANLDTDNSRSVLDQFRQINKEMKQTVIMISHEDWHREYFDRIIFLKDGRIDRIGTGGT